MPRKLISEKGEEIAEEIGIDAFVRLAERFGGQRLYVPHGLEVPGLADAIGREAADKFHTYYRGEDVKVPLARELFAQRYWVDGLSRGEIATRLRMTQSGVEKMFGRFRRSIRQQRDHGKSDSDIARLFGMPVEGVKTLFRPNMKSQQRPTADEGQVCDGT